jgi:hypothetical protein
MPKKWIVYLQGESIGSLSTELVSLLLHQNRLQFSDFVWSEGMKRWERLSEVTEFSGLLPKYPAVAVPGGPVKVTASDSVKAESPSPPTREPISAPAVKLNVRRSERVEIRATVLIEGQKRYPVVNISETGLMLGDSGDIKSGMEIKFTLTGETLNKPMSMTGITIREGVYEGESGTAIEFTKVNPAHKRILQDYVKSISIPRAA